MSHMAWRHTEIWSCQVPGHGEYIFNSSADFMQHLREHHPCEVPEQQFSSISEMCIEPAPDTLAVLASELASELSYDSPPVVPTACPFCDESGVRIEDTSLGKFARFPEGASEKLREHIAGHLESLALYSLPERDELGRSSFNMRLMTGWSTDVKSDDRVASSLSQEDPGESDLVTDFITDNPPDQIYSPELLPSAEDWDFMLSQDTKHYSINEDATLKAFSKAFTANRMVCNATGPTSQRMLNQNRARHTGMSHLGGIRGLSAEELNSRNLMRCSQTRVLVE